MKAQVLALAYSFKGTGVYLKVNSACASTTWLDMVSQIVTYWKENPLGAYLPNLRDGLYPVTKPTAKELARI